MFLLVSYKEKALGRQKWDIYVLIRATGELGGWVIIYFPGWHLVHDD